MQKVKYEVIRDTREQKNQGWFFEPGPSCTGTVIQKLDTGDYTLQGYEDIVAIERKRSTSELATNLNEARFVRELERLEAFQLPFIVCEFTLDDVFAFPENSGIPREKWSELKVTPQFLLRRINELVVKYKTRFIFAGNTEHAKAFVSSLFKRVVEHVKIGNID